MPTDSSPIEWLKVRKPEFASLSQHELAAILHFSLLWSFFEAKALNTSANAKRILEFAHRLDSEGRLRLEVFASALNYFQRRYTGNGEATEEFGALHFRRRDKKALVLSVLKAENVNGGDILGSLLIIVFRFRNNLFHGLKWEYGIQGQLQNFTHANDVLMAVLDANRGVGQSRI